MQVTPETNEVPYADVVNHDTAIPDDVKGPGTATSKTIDAFIIPPELKQQLLDYFSNVPLTTLADADSEKIFMLYNSIKFAREAKINIP
jgi:hypothetical protein